MFHSYVSLPGGRYVNSKWICWFQKLPPISTVRWAYWWRWWRWFPPLRRRGWRCSLAADAVVRKSQRHFFWGVGTRARERTCGCGCCCCCCCSAYHIDKQLCACLCACNKCTSAGYAHFRHIPGLMWLQVWEPLCTSWITAQTLGPWNVQPVVHWVCYLISVQSPVGWWL